MTKTILVALFFAASLTTNAVAAKDQIDYLTVYELEKKASDFSKKGNHKKAIFWYRKAILKGFPEYIGFDKIVAEHLKANQHKESLPYINELINTGIYNETTLLTAKKFRTLRSTKDWPKVLDWHNNFEKPKKAKSKVKIFTSDVHNFYVAFDKIRPTMSIEEKLDVYVTNYFKQGSKGFVDYYFLKIRDPYRFVKYVESNREFYESIRPTLSDLHLNHQALSESLHRVTSLVPNKMLPDAYYIIGGHSAAGTASPSGILLGADFIVGKKPILKNVKEWAKKFIVEEKGANWIVFHELMHYLQELRAETVLETALVEGAADFLADYFYMSQPKVKKYTQFGKNNDKKIWSRFLLNLNSQEISDWSGNNGVEYENWVPDLAYYVGADIASRYFERMESKEEAIRMLITLENPEVIFKTSRYEAKY